MVALQILILPVGVRVPARQPIFGGFSVNKRSLFIAAGFLALSQVLPSQAEGASSNGKQDGNWIAKATNDWTRIYVGARPSVSADGSKFAFEWNDRIWIAPVAGGTARALAAGDASQDSWPVLSPDAKRVSFISNRLDTDRLFEYSLENGSLRVVSPCTLPARPYSYAPDGTSIVAVVVRDHADTDNAMRAALVASNGFERVFFDAKASEPSLSPDGKRLLFVRGGDNIYRKRPKSFTSEAGEIWMYDIPSRAFTHVVQKKTDSRSPLWTPDGKGFYYVSGDGGSKNILHHDLATKKARAITFFKGDNVLQPTLSANGRILVFRQGFDFWRIDPTAANAKAEPILLHPDSSWTPPLVGKRNRWYTSIGNPDGYGGFSFRGPEGKEVAFTAGGDLWVMCMDCKEPVLVHGGTGTIERDCAFSPDGDALYYLTDHGDGTDLWVARREDPSKPWDKNVAFKKTRLLADGTTRLHIDISPDGKRLLWQDGSWRIHFADTNGLSVVDGPNMAADDVYAWSPDGKWLAAGFSDNHKNYDVWIVSTTASHEPVNVSRHFMWDGDPAWSPDGKILAWCGRRENNAPCRLHYLFLDGKEGKGAPNEIDFEDIDLRVKTVNVRASNPFFNADSRTLAFDDGTQTAKITIPGDLSPKRLTAKRGIAQRWGTPKDKGRLLWAVGNKPAHFETEVNINVYPVFNIAEYNELLGRTAWGRIRDRFYDPNFHGVDWPSMKAKYFPAFRHATSYSVLQRLVYMMLGELDASHLGFVHNATSRKEWVPEVFGQNWRSLTGHLGVRFDPDYKGPGWRVRDVLKGGVMDAANCGMRAGDIITEINNRKTSPEIMPAELLTGHDSLKITVKFGHPDEPATNVVRVKPSTYTRARELVGEAIIRARRAHVHKISDGRIGYVYVAAMDNASFKRFESEVFSEGYGRDALIVDVRNNHGGFTADRMLSILCAPSHSYEIPRNGRPGYLMSYTVHPVFTKPIAVLCNAETASNGEIFTHAVKTIKRGIVVGQTTGGAVIATNNRTILDYGEFRDAEFGWFVNGGIDMENHGAEPDIPVPLTPADEVRGEDPQLDTAIKELLKNNSKKEQK